MNVEQEETRELLGRYDDLISELDRQFDDELGYIPVFSYSSALIEAMNEVEELDPNSAYAYFLELQDILAAEL